MPLGASRLNGLSRFVSSAGPRTAATLTTHGNAQVDTAQYKFGGASALFDGASDGISVSANVVGVTLTGDYTIEAWVRIATTSGSKSVFDFRQESTGYPVYFISGAFIAVYQGGTTNGGTLSVNTWHHCVWQRSSGSILMFVDGVQSGSRTSGTSINWGESDIGSNYVLGSVMNGHIDELRVSDTARYSTGGFTPPTSAFSSDANTLLLVHADGSDGSTTFTDDVS